VTSGSACDQRFPTSRWDDLPALVIEYGDCTRNPTIIVFHALASALEIDLPKMMAKISRSLEK
jgi:hypothetical protein